MGDTTCVTEPGLFRVLVPVLLTGCLALALAACGDGAADAGPTQTTDALPDDPEELMAVALRASFRDPAATVEEDPDPAAVLKMGESGDERYVPVLVDILGFSWLLTPRLEEAVLWSLSSLSGLELTEENETSVWWVEQLSMREDVELPPGYARWKGNLYTKLIDSRIGSFLVDAEDPRIRLEEVVWGGVLRDGIPDLQGPPVVAAADAAYLREDDRVFGLSINGESRAYPLRVMNAHEMANDVLGGAAIALAYCTLCGSGVAYAAETGGETFSFGTSGLLYRGNKLMYDRQTQTLWVQFSGEPVIGPLQESGIVLERLPLTLTTWAEWLVQHPETTVLDNETGIYPGEVYAAESDPESPYYDYRAASGPIFPVHQRSGLLPDKEWVAGVSIAGQAVAYPLAVLDARDVVNDEVGGTEIVMIADGARAYERGGLLFVETRETEDGFVVVDGSGGEWRVTEDALVSADDAERTLARVDSQVAYWFAWFQFHTDTSVYEEGGD